MNADLLLFVRDYVVPVGTVYRTCAVRMRRGVRGRMIAMALESSNTVDGTEEACPVRTGKPEHVLIDGRLREYARRRSALDAAEAFDLVRAEELKLHFHWGYATFYEYME